MNDLIAWVRTRKEDAEAQMNECDQVGDITGYEYSEGQADAFQDVLAALEAARG